MFIKGYEVKISDINYGGHMGNEIPLILFQEARIAFFKEIGHSEISIGGEVGTIQKESHINYLKEVFHGEKLEIKIVKVDFKRSSFNIEYEINNESKECVVKGSTLMIAFNYEKRKIASIPKEFKEKVEEYLK